MTMMSPSHCAHEAAVQEAARRGTPGEAVLKHMAGCVSCRGTFEVTVWMARLAVETGTMAADRDLPDAARIWWRARLLQRWESETRATAPLDIMQRVEVVGGLIAAFVLLVTMWPELRGFERAPVSLESWWPALTSLLAPSGLMTWVIGGVLLLGLMAAFTVHQLLVED
jgi:hypothetical protein